jgi:hypothetical protein
MGGRGASSGISVSGNTYGTQYEALSKSGNVKFVKKINRQSEPLMETMTKGRVYAVTGKDGPTEITYFDNDGKRIKTIHLDHYHKGMKPHTHHGYFHSENDSKKGAANLTSKERALVEKVNKVWYNSKSNRK